MNEKGNSYSMVSFICGIVSLFFNVLFIPSILGLVFSRAALKTDETQKDNTFRKVGKVLSILSIVLVIAVIILYMLIVIPTTLNIVNQAV